MKLNLLEQELLAALRHWTGAAVLVLTVSLRLMSTHPAGAEILFFPARLDFAAGLTPISVAIEDLNGDQIPDLAVASGNYYSDDVAVLLGLGDGTFSYPTFYDAGDHPNSVAIEDLNGDHIPDLAVANGVHVAVLLGHGDGTFAAASFYDAGTTPTSVVIADVNGDQVPDLPVVANTGFSGEVAILLGLGDGTFAEPDFYDAGDYPNSVEAEDLNGDQIPDLAVATGGGGRGGGGTPNVAVLLGLGDGGFAPPSFYDAGSPWSVAIGDLNGDQVPDLALATPLSVAVLLGLGDGSFGEASFHTAGTRPRSVAIADLSGDQIPDLAIANAFSDDVSVLLGLGDGTFGWATSYGTGDAPYSVAIADLNGDQIPDLAVANAGSDNASVLLGLGDGTLNQASLYEWGGASIASADLNGDQIMDLAVANYANVSIFLGLGDGTFTPRRTYGAGHTPTSVVIADVNGDRVPDLSVVGNTGFEGQVAILLGLGDGSFAEASIYTVGDYLVSVAVADLNGDHAPDLAVTDYYANSVAVLFGVGDGTFYSPWVYGAGSEPRSVAIDDLNGDQVPDLAVANVGSHNVGVLLGFGNGLFAPVEFYGAGNGPWSVAIDDLNGDQFLDLTVTNVFDDNVAVLLGFGDGTFAEASFYGAGDEPRSLAIADLNGDQIPDLAVPNAFSNNVAVLLGIGDGAFDHASFYGAGYFSNGVAVEDLNGDYIPDLAVANTDYLAVLFGVEGGATPVELSFFEAIGSGEDVSLRWTTGREHDVHGFHVLRAKTAAITDATRITTSLIPGGQQTYAFADQNLAPGQYCYWLEEVTRSGALHHYGPRSVLVSPRSPELFLAQNNPNPFRKSTELTFSVPTPTPVTVGIYDAAGRLVRSLLDRKVVGAGEHRLTWDGRSGSGKPAASGIYFYRLRVGDQELERKLHVLR